MKGSQFGSRKPPTARKINYHPTIWLEHFWQLLSSLPFWRDLWIPMAPNRSFPTNNQHRYDSSPSITMDLPRNRRLGCCHSWAMLVHYSRIHPWFINPHGQLIVTTDCTIINPHGEKETCGWFLSSGCLAVSMTCLLIVTSGGNCSTGRSINLGKAGYTRYWGVEKPRVVKTRNQIKLRQKIYNL